MAMEHTLFASDLSIETFIYHGNLPASHGTENWDASDDLPGTWMAFLDLFWRHKAWLEASLCDSKPPDAPGYALLPEAGAVRYSEVVWRRTCVDVMDVRLDR